MAPSGAPPRAVVSGTKRRRGFDPTVRPADQSAIHDFYDTRVKRARVGSGGLPAASASAGEAKAKTAGGTSLAILRAQERAAGTRLGRPAAPGGIKSVPPPSTVGAVASLSAYAPSVTASPAATRTAAALAVTSPAKRGRGGGGLKPPTSSLALLRRHEAASAAAAAAAAATERGSVSALTAGTATDGAADGDTSLGVDAAALPPGCVPASWATLAAQYGCVEAALAFLRAKRSAATYAALRPVVEAASRHAFPAASLASLAALLPDGLCLSAPVGGAGSDHVRITLVCPPGVLGGTDATDASSAAATMARRRLLARRLRERVAAAYAAWRSTQHLPPLPPSPVDGDGEVAPPVGSDGWYPGWDVEATPSLPTPPLPVAPLAVAATARRATAAAARRAAAVAAAGETAAALAADVAAMASPSPPSLLSTAAAASAHPPPLARPTAATTTTSAGAMADGVPSASRTAAPSTGAIDDDTASFLPPGLLDRVRVRAAAAAAAANRARAIPAARAAAALPVTLDAMRGYLRGRPRGRAPWAVALMGIAAAHPERPTVNAVGEQLVALAAVVPGFCTLIRAPPSGASVGVGGKDVVAGDVMAVALTPGGSYADARRLVRRAAAEAEAVVAGIGGGVRRRAIVEA
ncbi:hypothetical protein MMPV_000062 [Pyropia vietnamensis]